MTNRPRPEDWEEFRKWRENNPLEPGKANEPYKDIEVIGNDFSKYFPPEQTAEEITKAEEYEQFFNTNLLDSEAGELIVEESKNIAERRQELLLVLDFLNWAGKKGTIPEQTTLLSLYKFIGDAVMEIHVSGKRNLSNEDKQLIKVLKVIIELRNEGLGDNSTIPVIIEKIGDKYDALKGIG